MPATLNSWNKRRRLTAIVICVMTVALLYVLSSGPMLMSSTVRNWTSFSVSSTRHDGAILIQEVYLMHVFYAPLDWARDKSETCNRFFEWYWRLFISEIPSTETPYRVRGGVI